MTGAASPERFDRATALGMGFMLLSVACYSAGDAIVKHLGADTAHGAALGVFQIVFVMSVWETALTLPMALVQGRRAFHLKRPWLFALRALLAFAGLLCMLFAITNMPLGTASTLINLETVFLAPLAVLILKERLSRTRIIALGLGFAGAAILLSPSADVPLIPALAAVGAGLLFALRTTVLKIIAVTETRIAGMIWLVISWVILSAPLAALSWDPMTLAQHGWFVALAITSIGARWLMIEGYRTADAIALAPALHANIPAALFVGFVLFGETPGLVEWGGIALVFAATILPTLRLGRTAPQLRK